jgi:hypothetical protein
MTSYGAASAGRQHDNLARLEELIRDLDDRMDTPQGLLREHLTAARFYLLGAMAEEYKMTLGLARALLPQIEPPDLHSRIGDFLSHQP